MDYVWRQILFSSNLPQMSQEIEATNQRSPRRKDIFEKVLIDSIESKPYTRHLGYIRLGQQLGWISCHLAEYCQGHRFKRYDSIVCLDPEQRVETSQALHRPDCSHQGS
jgi:hypothetical protein